MPHISVAYFEKAVVTPLYAMNQKATEASRNMRDLLTSGASLALPEPSSSSSSSVRPNSFSVAILSATN